MESLKVHLQKYQTYADVQITAAWQQGQEDFCKMRLYGCTKSGLWAGTTAGDACARGFYHRLEQGCHSILGSLTIGANKRMRLYEKTGISPEFKWCMLLFSHRSSCIPSSFPSVPGSLPGSRYSSKCVFNLVRLCLPLFSSFLERFTYILHLPPNSGEKNDVTKANDW